MSVHREGRDRDIRRDDGQDLQLRAGDHPHAAFKSHRLVDVADNVVTLDAEIYNPDGSTFETTIEHRLDPPRRIETRMIAGIRRMIDDFTTVFADRGARRLQRGTRVANRSRALPDEASALAMP